MGHDLDTDREDLLAGFLPINTAFEYVNPFVIGDY